MTALPSLTPIIAGPTAGGKSDLAVELALALRERQAIPAEIISADAFQVYTGLDIGTAKPSIEERRGVPHHLIDIVGGGSRQQATGNRQTPDTSSLLPAASCRLPSSFPFTVSDWLALATAKIADLRASNILPIVVGGTHLYIKALLDGLFDGPEPNPALREALTAMDPAARRAELERIDPAAAARIHPNDLRRTVRALEVFRLTGTPISAHQRQWDRAVSPPHPDTPSPPRSPFLLTLLDWDPEALNRRVNARVKRMMDRGLPDEVHRLHLAGAFTAQSAEALGYKQLLPLCRGPWPPPSTALEAAVEQIKIETRRFAKNQRTWLRRLRTTPGCLALPCPVIDTAAAVEANLRKLGAE